MDPINDGLVFWEEDSTNPEANPSDITMPENDKKEDTAEDKEESTPEVVEKTESTETQKDSEATTEDEDDLDLSDLFADLEDASASNEESQKILDDAAAAGGTISPDQIKELEAQLSIQKDINTKLSGQVKKLMNDSVDMSYKNAELEAFGGVSTNPNVLILSKNLEKAQAGDDKSKSKVLSVLKSLYEEFTGEDLEKTKVWQQTDLLAAVDSYNSSSNPNIKWKSSDTIEWLSM